MTNSISPMDPEVLRALVQLRTDGRAVPAVGDIESRRRNAGALFEQVLPAAEPNTAIAVQHFSLETADGATLPMSWYHPADAAGPGSAVLYLHGGGMIMGLEHLGHLYDHAVRAYVAASGVPMLMVDYRIAPEYPHPVPAEDCYTALQWLAAYADELGVDTNRLAVMGDSAGGGLAAAVCLLARDRSGPPVAQQILIYPMLDDRTITSPLDTALLTWSCDDNVTGWTALLGSATGTDMVSPYAAPARATDLAGLPPSYIDVGGLDLFCDEDIDYARRLSAAGVATELHLYPGCPHAYEWLATDAVVAQQVKAHRIRRLRAL